ncbi:30S ribosomal protein S2 [Candidatus Berkelbacteria bacterium]|nr:30S ribosomal protein S2 [Candidatus Berkelbacteria bacterium]
MATKLPTLKDLIDAGAHFGHRRSRTYPKAKKFTYTLRDSVYVINVEQTLEYLEKAAKVAEEFAKENKTILLVGTKAQATDLVKEVAQKAGIPFINHRWLGGTLSNFATIHSNLSKLKTLTELSESERFAEFTKKERGRITKQIAKLTKVFDGIRDLDRIPDLMIVVDINEEDIAVTEARGAGVPVIGIVDTNSNPDLVNYPIPANDDSKKTISLILNVLTDAIAEGKKAAPAVTKAEADPKATKAEKVAAATKKEEKDGN